MTLEMRNCLDCHALHFKTIPQLAAALDLEINQVENLLDIIKWHKSVRVGANAVKARAEDARPACVVIPFMRLINND